MGAFIGGGERADLQQRDIRHAAWDEFARDEGDLLPELFAGRLPGVPKMDLQRAHVRIVPEASKKIGIGVKMPEVWMNLL